MSASSDTGVIHDIGYRSYDGERLGRGGIVAALGLPLNRMEQRRHRLEELFRDEEAGDIHVG